MTIKERDAFTCRCLLVLTTARTDHDHKTMRVVPVALAKACGIPVNYSLR